MGWTVRLDVYRPLEKTRPMIISFLHTSWPLLFAGFTLLLSLATAGHAIIYKRDSRAAVGWVGLIWLAPLIGSILYILLGINRVRRRVSGKRGDESQHLIELETFACSPSSILDHLGPDEKHLAEMARMNERLSGMALLKGNRIEPLLNGDEAYPAMCQAIDQSTASLTLTSYIFDNDRVGQRFVAALSRAVQRGVEVRVLIDAVGARYSIPPVIHRLRIAGVRVARFMPNYLPWSTPYINLRSHRKLLVADGRLAFTGGMNIRADHVLGDAPRYPTLDIHFQVTGPVVHELQATFAEDWLFTTGERLQGDLWFAPPENAGPILARALPDGPDKDYDKMRKSFHGALSVAERSVLIVTPYFLPDASLISAINSCALRGVDVDILLPSQNNLKLVAWASMAQMWQILEWGCRVWMAPPPFDHSKLLVVDGAWTLIGSPNWDARSLRLNFELALESYDTAFARRIEEIIREKMKGAHPLTLDEVNSRPLPIQLRDGAARLLSPYL